MNETKIPDLMELTVRRGGLMSDFVGDAETHYSKLPCPALSTVAGCQAQHRLIGPGCASALEPGSQPAEHTAAMHEQGPRHHCPVCG